MLQTCKNEKAQMLREMAAEAFYSANNPAAFALLLAADLIEHKDF